MTATVPSDDVNKMADLVGPFHTVNDVAAALGVSPTVVTTAARQARLLCVHTSDDVPLLPTFQFAEQATVRPDLYAVLSLLSRVPAWSAAVWLRTPNDALGGQTPEQAAADPSLALQVEVLARRWAHRLDMVATLP